MVHGHKCSVLDRVKSRIDTHLDTGIRPRMNAALDASSVALVNCRVKLFLRKLRNMGAVCRKDLHPVRPVAHLPADLLSDLPRAVHFFCLIPCMPACHTHPCIRMGDLRHDDKSLLRRQL